MFNSLSLLGSCPWDFPGKSTGVGCHALLQGIFLTQGSNPHLLRLLLWQAGSLHKRHLGDTLETLYGSGVQFSLWTDFMETVFPHTRRMVWGWFKHITFIVHLSDAQWLSCAWFFATPWTVACKDPLFLGFPRQVVCHFLLQGISPIQESNWHLSHLLHWQTDSLPLSHLRIPLCTLFLI